MSKGLEEYLKRCATDAEFRALEEADFDAAVAEYDLDENEKQELRDYLQSDRHRAIEGSAMRAFDEMVSGMTGEPSAEEMKLIEERERRNLASMLSHPADAELRAALIGEDASPKTSTPADTIVAQLRFRSTRVEDWPGSGRFRECVKVVDKGSGEDTLVSETGAYFGGGAKQKLESLRRYLGLEGKAFYEHLERLAKESKLQEAQAAVESQVQKSMEAIEAGAYVGPQCLMCGEPKPSFAWFKGWRRDLCPTHKNASPAELMIKLRTDMEATKRWMDDKGI